MQTFYCFFMTPSYKHLLFTSTVVSAHPVNLLGLELVLWMLEKLWQQLALSFAYPKWSFHFFPFKIYVFLFNYQIPFKIKTFTFSSIVEFSDDLN